MSAIQRLKITKQLLAGTFTATLILLGFLYAFTSAMKRAHSTPTPALKSSTQSHDFNTICLGNHEYFVHVTTWTNGYAMMAPKFDDAGLPVKCKN